MVQGWELICGDRPSMPSTVSQDAKFVLEFRSDGGGDGDYGGGDGSQKRGFDFDWENFGNYLFVCLFVCIFACLIISLCI